MSINGLKTLSPFESGGFHMLAPQYVTFGNFSIYALPKGTITPLPGGDHRITVKEVYLFAHDNFNFEGDQFLGTWDPEEKKMLPFFPSESARFIGNNNFHDFRDQTGYGLDFPIISNLYKVENFNGFYVDVK